MVHDGYLRIGVSIARGMVVAGHKVLLPKKEINRALARRRWASIDVGVVSQALHEAQFFRGEEVIDDIPVWSLDPAWWNNVTATYCPPPLDPFRLPQPPSGIFIT
jgi:hypothetical protein